MTEFVDSQTIYKHIEDTFREWAQAKLGAEYAVEVRSVLPLHAPMPAVFEDWKDLIKYEHDDKVVQEQRAQTQVALNKALEVYAPLDAKLRSLLKYENVWYRVSAGYIRKVGSNIETCAVSELLKIINERRQDGKTDIRSENNRSSDL